MTRSRVSGVTTAVASDYNIQRTVDLYASVSGRDLGGVAKDVRKILAEPIYRDNAKAMMERMRSYDAGNQASILLERLAKTHQPILRDAPLSTAEMQAVPAL